MLRSAFGKVLIRDGDTVSARTGPPCASRPAEPAGREPRCEAGDASVAPRPRSSTSALIRSDVSDFEGVVVAWRTKAPARTVDASSCPNQRRVGARWCSSAVLQDSSRFARVGGVTPSESPLRLSVRREEIEPQPADEEEDPPECCADVHLRTSGTSVGRRISG